jgi:hypothetical protein
MPNRLFRGLLKLFVTKKERLALQTRIRGFVHNDVETFISDNLFEDAEVFLTKLEGFCQVQSQFLKCTHTGSSYILWFDIGNDEMMTFEVRVSVS